MLMMDSWGQDMPSEDSSYNWFASSQDMTDRTQTSPLGYFIWNNLYKQLGLANQVIATPVSGRMAMASLRSERICS